MPTISFDLTFQKSSTPPSMLMVDTTTYADPTVVVGKITGTGPSGVFYTGLYSPPDIDPDVSTSSAAIPLPLNIDGEIAVGSYTIEYDVKETIAAIEFPIVSADGVLNKYSVSGDVREHYTNAIAARTNPRRARRALTYDGILG